MDALLARRQGQGASGIDNRFSPPWPVPQAAAHGRAVMEVDMAGSDWRKNCPQRVRRPSPELLADSEELKLAPYRKMTSQ